MKTYNLLILFWLIVFIAICLVLSSCTETIYEDIIKTDTVFISKPQSIAPTFITKTDTVHVIDTVEVRVVIHDVDTVFQVVTKDSIIIKEVEKIVNHVETVTLIERDTVIKEVIVQVTDTVIQIVHDTTTVTVYDRTAVYLDTAYVMIYWRNVTAIPQEIQPHVTEFFSLVNQYNKTVPGGHMIIQYTDDLPGENWVSHSYWVGGTASSDNPYAQMVIEISESLPPELHRASILRELGRLQMKKKYVTDVTKIMSPLFPPEAVITTNHLNQLFQ